MKSGLLHYAASEVDTNMYYATRFLAPDPFLFCQVDGRKYMVASDLEFGRAKAEARVDEIVSASALEKKSERPGVVELIVTLLKELGVEEAIVPDNFGVALADDLRARGVHVEPKKGVFFESRPIKTAEEVRAIQESIRVAESAIDLAVTLLRQSKIRGDEIVFEKQVLTSERLREYMNTHMMSLGCFPSHTIVAGGDQACDPHHKGSGPLKANRPIVLDVFPRSLTTMYWGDITRTVLKGKPSPEIKKMYEAVRVAQKIGCDLLHDGADGKEIHQKIQGYFDSGGYKTEQRDGKFVGYFHGTGHGVGLDIHELPSIGKRGTRLQTGHVVTVEPGLYYPGIGGIRLEDDLLVESSGSRNLAQYPRTLQID